MHATKSSRPAAAAAFPMPKGLIWGLCVPAPIAGSILYYVWRRSHPEAANYANRASWICWGVLIGGIIVLSAAVG
jgi:hypothetical protein